MIWLSLKLGIIIKQIAGPNEPATNIIIIQLTTPIDYVPTELKNLRKVVIVNRPLALNLSQTYP